MAGDWHLVASTDVIEEEDVLGVNVEGTAVAVYNVNGQFYATENVCTHAFAFLSEGVVIDDIIEMPGPSRTVSHPHGCPERSARFGSLGHVCHQGRGREGVRPAGR